MRKYMIGILIGVLLSFPLSAYGQELASLIGKSVQAENVVVVNGEELAVKAINIGGTTYSPNRAIANALGLDIKFEDSKVIFDTKAGEDAGVEQTTFEGMRAIIVGDQTYFSPKDYNDKYSESTVIHISFDAATRTSFYSEREAVSISTVVARYDIGSADDPEVTNYYNGETYINAKYYREPADFASEQPAQ